MHIAQTVKENVPPSNSVPGGRQHDSLTRDKKRRRGKSSVNEKTVNTERLCHMKS